ncbi:uncharacterized protein BDR25DRAFT_300762 [Lindgomyces ingoldianus]|uniref:Uncharacterized protein n=1 Tax=Lindgomyces ingoldianus TaxID=673940 RepID=A0ACB6R8Z9_9PLEO|nr:uncharacterized protein BDR25DRAFT_300762 [Lindgomyces ingoldianus]KAF2475788.1 hypothetical protein BDR25DRAFT_300762 [Lindgomyces ingoldianus]
MRKIPDPESTPPWNYPQNPHHTSPLQVEWLPSQPSSTVILEEAPSVMLEEARTLEAKVNPFRFLDLPAELRNAVYHHLITNGEVLQFERMHQAGRFQYNVRNNNKWRVRVRRGTDGLSKLDKCTALFYVSKLVSNEAKAVLYGQNTFRFTIDGKPHQPNSLHSSQIFGPLGFSNTLPLLRNLRSIEIQVEHDSLAGSGHWENKRHRGRMEHLVNILKEHADDEDKRSLLKQMKVRFSYPPDPYRPNMARNGHFGRLYPHNVRRSNQIPPEDVIKRMFAFESLAALRGIEEVQIDGLQDWFRQCLEMVMMGNGGELVKIEYPDIWVKRRKEGSRRAKKILATTRAWWQPLFNWEEFAQRNGIYTPKDADIMQLGM